MAKVAALILVISGFLTTTWAQELPESATMQIPLGQLKLTDTQRADIRQIRVDLQKRRCELTGRIIDAQEGIRQLFAKEPVDAERLAEASRELALLQQQLSELRLAATNRVESLLTAEQLEELRRWRAAKPRGPTDQPELLWEYGEPQLYPYPQEGSPSDQRRGR